MFGYIRPVRDSLSEDDYGIFRAAYCALCHSMKKRCGTAARFTLNFDFTFLAMLLSCQCEVMTEQRRCIAHPFQKRTCSVCSAAFDSAADMSVILTYLKLDDNIRDEHFFRALASRLAKLMLLRGYRKACARQPKFALTARERLAELNELERSGSCSLDLTADKFAQILSAAALAAPDAERRRVLSYLFYHIGRIVYIVDAVDDLPDDIASGAYNAVRQRFSLQGPVLDEKASQRIDQTLRHSLNLAASDYQLLSGTMYSGVLANIIYLGLPSAASKVLRSRLPDYLKETGDKE